jgi:hypothetical protein
MLRSTARRSDEPLGAGPELLPEGEAHRVAEDLAARDRSRLEALLAADDERIDVSVVTAGPRWPPLSRPARRRSSCSQTSQERPAGLTQHRVGDPGSPCHGGGRSGPVGAGGMDEDSDELSAFMGAMTVWVPTTVPTWVT